MKKLYTTVTLSDFKDHEYSNKLIQLAIGMELALLETDLLALKKEISSFKNYFDTFNISIETIRVHQPGGQAYYWSDRDGVSGFTLLNDFFSYCAQLGFQNFVIHTPYGDAATPEDEELKDYRDKLAQLALYGQVEVEEISASNRELKDPHTLRLYNGDPFEQLMAGQRATMLLDTNECGGVEKTIDRFKQLTKQGFDIRSIHLHKDKHKFLSANEVKRLSESTVSENLINEGFVREGSSFDEFIQTKSVDCIVPNQERVKILEGYTELLHRSSPK